MLDHYCHEDMEYVNLVIRTEGGETFAHIETFPYWLHVLDIKLQCKWNLCALGGFLGRYL